MLEMEENKSKKLVVYGMSMVIVVLLAIVLVLFFGFEKSRLPSACYFAQNKLMNTMGASYFPSSLNYLSRIPVLIILFLSAVFLWVGFFRLADCCFFFSLGSYFSGIVRAHYYGYINCFRSPSTCCPWRTFGLSSVLHILGMVLLIAVYLYLSKQRKQRIERLGENGP